MVLADGGEPVTLGGDPGPVYEPPTCGNCPYWDADNKGMVDSGYIARCRRFPPTAQSTPTRLGPVCLHPVTPESLVCGEHPSFLNSPR